MEMISPLRNYPNFICVYTQRNKKADLLIQIQMNEYSQKMKNFRSSYVFWHLCLHMIMYELYLALYTCWYMYMHI